MEVCFLLPAFAPTGNASTPEEKKPLAFTLRLCFCLERPPDHAAACKALLEARRLFDWAYQLDCQGVHWLAALFRREGRRCFERFLQHDGRLGLHQWHVEQLETPPGSITDILQL